MRLKRENISAALSLVVMMVMAVGCAKDAFEDMKTKEGYRVGNTPSRIVRPAERQVFLIYSAGFNTLSADLESDVEEFKQGYVPSLSSPNVVLVYSKRTAPRSGFSTKTPSYLVRLYSEMDGKVVADTLKRWSESAVAASPQTLRNVWEYVRSNYPATHYGMLFSSHASGWVPPGYYMNGKITTAAPASSSVSSQSFANLSSVPVPYSAPVQLPGVPSVRSLGMDNKTNSSAYEMDIEEFAKAIPVKLDYLIFDACLMGCVEVAYALKDKCSRILFSPAEVLSDGMCVYEKLGERLLMNPEQDLESVCNDAYDFYDKQTGQYRSLTISMVDCKAMDQLATACSRLFSDYAQNLSSVNPDNVQGYFRFGKSWFYDIEDILLKSGVPQVAMADFYSAMDRAVPYKKSTQYFIDFKIDTYSGMSMFLPVADNDPALKEYYKTLSWNKATGLVR